MKKIFKRMLLSIIIFCVALAAGVALFMRQPQFGKSPTGERLERMKRSPNYRNGAFQNLEPTPDLAEGVNMLTVLRSFLFSKTPRQVPTDTIPHVRTDLKALVPQRDVLIWFGHSSYLLQVDGKRILVDPVFNGHASPVSFTTRSFPGTRAFSTEDMPMIDVLVITHDHWDHLDYPTVRKLQANVSRVICPLGVGAHLEHWGYPAAKITELDWHEAIDLGAGFGLRATPARHFSGRGFKRNGTLWASFVLETPSKRIFIGGDSGYGKHFADIGHRYGPFDLALLEDGQYNPYWIYIHMMPEQVLLAARELQAKYTVPVHNSKFSLAMHAWDEPLVRITEANQKSGRTLWTPQIGQAVDLNDSTHVFPRWWEGVN